MLRWLIALLLVANLIALAAIQGLFGPPPAAGPREASHLTRQVRPQALRVTATAQAAEPVVIGGPIASPSIDTQPLGASAPAAASGASGAAASAPSSAAASAAAPGSAPVATSGASAASAPSAPAAPHAQQAGKAAPLAGAGSGAHPGHHHHKLRA